MAFNLINHSRSSKISVDWLILSHFSSPLEFVYQKDKKKHVVICAVAKWIIGLSHSLQTIFTMESGDLF